MNDGGCQTPRSSKPLRGVVKASRVGSIPIHPRQISPACQQVDSHRSEFERGLVLRLALKPHFGWEDNLPRHPPARRQGENDCRHIEIEPWAAANNQADARGQSEERRRQGYCEPHMHTAEHAVGARVHLNGPCDAECRHQDDDEKQFDPDNNRALPWNQDYQGDRQNQEKILEIRPRSVPQHRVGSYLIWTQRDRHEEQAGKSC